MKGWETALDGQLIPSPGLQLFVLESSGEGKKNLDATRGKNVRNLEDEFRERMSDAGRHHGTAEDETQRQKRYVALQEREKRQP